MEESVFSNKTESFEIQVASTISDISQVSCLFPSELEKFYAMQSAKRKAEFLSSRILLQSMLGANYSMIEYAESGKPFLKNYNISISHSKNYAAIIGSENCNVAIDIEQYRDSTIQIANRFLTEKESQEFTNLQDMTLVWSAKEVLFKLWNASPDFKKHYCVTHLSANTLQGVVSINSFEKVVKMSYVRNSNYCLVWACLEPEN